MKFKELLLNEESGSPSPDVLVEPLIKLINKHVSKDELDEKIYVALQVRRGMGVVTWEIIRLINKGTGKTMSPRWDKLKKKYFPGDKNPNCTDEDIVNVFVKALTKMGYRGVDKLPLIKNQKL